MKKEGTNRPIMAVAAVLLLVLAGFLIMRAMGSRDEGGPADIDAMMPKTGQAAPIAPEEVAGSAKGVLPGGKH